MNRATRSYKPELEARIRLLLERTPAQSIKELAERLGVNRTFLAGYLQALEDRGHLHSRKVGPARMYYNARMESAPK